MKQIPLTQGKEALVSDCDYKFLMQWNWYYTKGGRNGGYAARKGPYPVYEMIYMHKVIATRKGLQGIADHSDQNKLNNNRRNLREADRKSNAGNCALRCNNTSGFRGVTWYKRTKQWRAQITRDCKTSGLGYYPGTEEGRKAAAQAYNRAARKHFGKFAFLNKV